MFFSLSKPLKDKIAVGLGNSLDWYDFALYGYFTHIFATIFFPQNNHYISFILSIFSWLIGCLIRPLGAIIFGHIGDKYGRVVCFQASSLLLFVPAIILPVLPTYNQIGVAAPIILIILRMVQGICIGGEFAGNIVYLCETSPDNKRYFFGSIGSCTASFGILCASIVATLINVCFSNHYIEWIGWRLAFFIAFLLNIVIYFMRKKAFETELFKELKKNKKIPTFPIKLLIEKKEFFIGLGLIYLHATSFYMVFMFLPIYAQKYLSVSTTSTLVNSSFLLAIRILIIPWVGILCDRVGGLAVLRASSISSIILTIPCFFLINSSIIINTYIGTLILALLTTLNAGSVPGLLLDIVPKEIRCSMMSLIFNVGFGIFGGAVPLISIYLIEGTSFNITPGIYVIFSAFVTLFVVQGLNYKGEKNEKILTYH